MSLLQTTRQIHVNAGGSTEGAIYDFGVSSSDLNPPVTATITWGNDGALTYSGEFASNYWCNPGVYAGNYWGRMTLISGINPSTGTMNTWLALSTNRTWTNTVTLADSQRLSSLRFQISTDSGGTNIISSIDFDLTATAGLPI